MLPTYKIEEVEEFAVGRLYPGAGKNRFSLEGEMVGQYRGHSLVESTQMERRSYEKLEGTELIRLFAGALICENKIEYVRQAGKEQALGSPLRRMISFAIIEALCNLK